MACFMVSNYYTPIITVIGKKNVGKSTLFNRIINKNQALIANYPGLTRDRQYGFFNYNQFDFIIIDTGGIEHFCLNNIKLGAQNNINSQIIVAIEEADLVLFMIDGQYEKSSIDYDIVDALRVLEKDIFVVINKIDDITFYTKKMGCFYYSFGLDNVVPISAMHGYGIKILLEKIFYKVLNTINDNNPESISNDINIDCLKNKKKYIRRISLNNKKQIMVSNVIKLAIVGRPNSGKSTFVNCILGRNRMIVCDRPGTTRDSIYTPLTYDNRKYLLIDTAGVRKKKTIFQLSEELSILRTLQVIKDAHIIISMIDISLGITDQDLSLLKFIHDNGKALVVIFNKWDILSKEKRSKNTQLFFRKQIGYINNFIRVHFISALYGIGIKNIFQSVQEACRCSVQFISVVTTSQLTRIMYSAVKKKLPPLLCGKRIRPKYVHIGGLSPIILIIHGSKVTKLPEAYRRYLQSFFYNKLKIKGVLLHLQFKDTVNPFLKK